MQNKNQRLHRSYLPGLAPTLASVLLVSACGGGSSYPLSLSLSPSKLTANVPGGTSVPFTVTATGSGSVSGTLYVFVVDSAGVLDTGITINQVSADTYQAQIATSNKLSAGEHSGNLQVEVCGDASCAKVFANTPLPYEFNVQNPTPTLLAINATSATAGCGDFTLNALGSNFVAASKVLWNGSPRATTFVSPTQLTAQITSADVLTSGIAQVTVSSPAPGGGTTTESSFAIAASGVTTDYTAFQVDAAHSGLARTVCPFNLAATPLWTSPLSDISVQPVIGQGKVFLYANNAGINGSTIEALDAGTGLVAWGPATDLVHTVAGLSLGPGKVFASYASLLGLGVGGAVAAFDTQNGATIWSVTPQLTGAYGSPIAANGEVLFYGSALAALDQTSGNTIWSTTSPSGAGTLAATQDAVYVCGSAAFGSTDGIQIWARSPFDGCAGRNAVPVATGTSVYIPNDYNQHLVPSGGVIVDAATGATIGTFPSETPPIVVGPTAYVVTGGHLAAIDLASGSPLWNFHSYESIDLAPPILVNGSTLVIGSSFPQAVVYAVDAATGQVLSKLTTGLDSVNTLSIGSNLLVLGGNHLEAYRISSGP